MDSVRRYRVSIKADGIIEAKEYDDCHERVPRQLDKDVGKHEGLPAVGLAGSFTDFVESSLGHEVRHDLLHKLSEDGEEHENAEKLILQALVRE